ncbi:hypothetical protein [Bradyrhizobium sp.]|uniref:hypothetical protein n=1 Tax=Bradyrhizobium sp. TaxID=376 RepID=UPI0025C72430|nr:hypothetical protein [Bradyrhizobium sp.]
MTSKRACFFEMLPVLAVLAASPSVAQSNKEQMHHQHPGGDTMRNASEAPAQLPPLKILMPENGATVGTRLAIVFQTPADLSKMTMSAPVPGTHLHIDAQDVSMMPSREQLVRFGEDRYLFLFDLPAKPGKNTLRVYWSDAQHRTIADTVQQITVTVARDAPQ